MSYEFHGEISVSDINTDAIKEAVNAVIIEQEYDEESIALIESVDYSNNYMYYYSFGLDEDTTDTYEIFFCYVTNKIVALYPYCSMYAHICGTEMASDTEFVYTVQLQNGHVRVLDFEYINEWVKCPNPDCEGGLVSWGELNFDTEYDCDECGRHVTAAEMNEITSECVHEYDVEEFNKIYNS